MTDEELVTRQQIIKQIIDGLNRVDVSGDCEVAHRDADNLLVSYLRLTGHAAVADAYDRVRARARWWACA